MMAKPPNSTKNTRPKGIQPRAIRTHAPRPLGHSVERLTKSMLGRRGFAHGAIVTKWPDIVGRELARHTQPEKIVFSRDGVSGGTLHLRCDSGALAIEVQHQEPQVIERINTFFGYKAVIRLKLIQGPLPRLKSARPLVPHRPLNPQEKKQLSQTIAIVDDDELREVLERLGQSIVNHDGRRNRS